jgi:hypothetical protein
LSFCFVHAEQSPELGDVGGDPPGHERTNLPLTLGGKVITSKGQSSRTGKPMRRREFITVIGAVAGLPVAARAQEAGRTPPREIQTLIDNHINGFNTQNIQLFLGVFGDTAIIIDGIAPYRWLNPNAPANWLADVEKWRKDLGVSHEHLSYEMGFWNVEGADAYAVIAGTLTATIKGQTVTLTGTLAYTFSKHGEEWKIDAQAWGRTS